MKNKMISMALFALSLLSLAGCQGEESIPVDLAVITLNGRNMPACDPSVLKNVVVETASGVGSTVSLILADGEPALEQSLTFGEWEGKSTYMRDKELEERYQQVSALLAESRAQEEESDLVRSIGLAARALQSGSGSEKRLVVVHSGINTCSPLAMQDLPDLTVLGPSTVEELAEADYLADLSGCSVDWYFLGDTAGGTGNPVRGPGGGAANLLGHVSDGLRRDRDHIPQRPPVRERGRERPRCGSSHAGVL